MRKMLAILLSFSLLTIFACAEKVDIEADKAALNKLLEEWDMNVKAGNFEAQAESYTDNAIRMEEGVIVGKEAIRNSFKTFHEEFNITKCDNKAEDIRVSGDLAVIRGSFSGTFVPKDGGEPIHPKSLWVAVFERQLDGSWKMAYDLGKDIKE
ncbi:MAG: DUF4440 domain-containing protein [Bacteroidetes bacterium]|nr:DUF4440 domain-containing protein [Bacteroidota bacterium]